MNESGFTARAHNAQVLRNVPKIIFIFNSENILALTLLQRLSHYRHVHSESGITYCTIIYTLPSFLSNYSHLIPAQCVIQV